MTRKQLLKKFKSELFHMKRELGTVPKNVAAYLANGGTLTEWEFRTVGGYTALAEALGYAVEPEPKVEPGSPAELSLKLRQAKNEIERLRKMHADAERLAASSSSIRELIMGTDREYEPDTDWLKGAKNQKTAGTRGMPSLILSDLHFDEVVDKKQMNGMNEYNHEIAVRRIKAVFSRFVELYKAKISSPNWEGCILNLLGDNLSGTIHDELEINNEYVVNQSILSVEELLIDGIAGLAEEFKKVFIPCIVGNHGRQNKKPRAKNYAWENYEWLIYMHLQRHFKNDHRVSIVVNDATDYLYPVYGRNYLVQHGQEFKGGNGIGGIMIPILRGLAKKQAALAAVNKTFHTALMGHFHTRTQTSQLVINGSTKGYDEWTKQMGFSYEAPQQAAWVEHPEHGPILATPILCD